jgi:flagellar basal-body rod protein FlgF/flagellar basal-body rod protein FlgG
MIRGLYAAASGLQAASEQQDVTAYNLANSSTSGYRERGLVYESFDRVLGRIDAPTGDIDGVHVVQAYSDFRTGALQATGQPYDLALADPDRFFVLNGPNGQIYTRNGNFYPNAEGQLISQGGYTLQGEDGPITIPRESTKFNIASDGSITANDEQVGRIRLVRFANVGQLTAAGPSLYTAPPSAGRQNVPGRVLQGYREGSNVQPADTMVRMIIGSRYYDAVQRSLRAIADAIQLDTRPSQGS